MDNNMTLAGFGGYGSHREIRVKKVENGYVLKAKITREHKDEEHPHKVWKHVEEETYIFYTLPELIGAVQNYFDSPKEDLQR